MVCDSGCRGFEPHQSPHFSLPNDLKNFPLRGWACQRAWFSLCRAGVSAQVANSAQSNSNYHATEAVSWCMTNSRVKTLDGKRTGVEQINLGRKSASPDKIDAEPASFFTRCRRWLHNANLVMAGMYTGLTCHGTPHTHHSYEDKQSNSDSEDGYPDAGADKKPDNRPI